MLPTRLSGTIHRSTLYGCAYGVIRKGSIRRLTARAGIPRWRRAGGLLLAYAAIFLTAEGWFAGCSGSASCRPAPAIRLLTLNPVDTTVLEENDSSVIASIKNIVHSDDWCVIFGYDDAEIVVRSRATGRILFRYAIPLDVTDSVFAIEKDSLIRDEGRLGPKGMQIYSASRRVLPPDVQALRLRHRILSVAFPDEGIMLVHAQIAGVIYNPGLRQGQYATSWTQALLRLRVPSCTLERVTKLRTWTQEYLLTSGCINADGTRIAFGAVDRRWFDVRKPFAQNSMSVFTVEDAVFRFFATRDSGNFSSMAAYPVTLWRGPEAFCYADGDDCAVHRSDDGLRYPVPADSSSGVGVRGRHFVRGITASDSTIAMYRVSMTPGHTSHALHMYDETAGRYLGSARIDDARDEVLHVALDPDRRVAVYFKGEDVYRIRYSIDLASSPIAGSAR